MNFRYGGSGYVYTAKGVNIPVMLVKTLSGESVSSMKAQITEHSVFVNERMCMEDWYKGYITTGEYKNLICSSDISFVFDVEDRGPQVRYRKVYNTYYLKRIVNKIVRKQLR